MDAAAVDASYQGTPDDFVQIIVELNITNADGEPVVFPGPGAIRFGCR